MPTSLPLHYRLILSRIPAPQAVTDQFFPIRLFNNLEQQSKRCRLKVDYSEEKLFRTEKPMSKDHPTELNLNEINLGLRLRATRRIKGMRLKELSDLAGCSESMISKIENGRSQPSLQMLHQLCSALGVSIASLFETEPASGPIQRKGERQVLSMKRGKEEHPIRIECIVPIREGSILEANIHIIPRDAETQGQISHEGEEFGYVLEGQLELHLADEIYLLEAGDSFCFHSDTRHGYRNPGQTITRVLWANSPPTF